MDTEYFRKNVLDLRYQEQLQKLNAVLVFISVGVLSFVGTFVWKFELLGVGVFISVAIIVIGYTLYKITKDRMNGILSEIESIKSNAK